MAKKKSGPAMPEALDGEAVLEWDRVCDELRKIGRLETTDRAILTLYCQTWAVNHKVAEHVAKFGAVVKWSNGVPGQGPWYKTLRETTELLRKLLEDLGLTPASRPTAPADSSPAEFKF